MLPDSIAKATEIILVCVLVCVRVFICLHVCVFLRHDGQIFTADAMLVPLISFVVVFFEKQTKFIALLGRNTNVYIWPT